MTYKMWAEVVLWPGTNPWHFIYIPKEKSAKFRKKFNNKHRGWNSLPVEVKIGKTAWRTSIFFDRKSECYLLPVKAEVRKKEAITYGEKVNFSMEILLS